MNFLMGAHEILMYLVGFVFIMFCNIIVYGFVRYTFCAFYIMTKFSYKISCSLRLTCVKNSMYIAHDYVSKLNSTNPS